MKFLFLLSVILPTLSFAQVKDVHIQNFSLTYQDPSGKGYASHFDYSLPGKSAPQEEQTVEVTKSGEDFHLILTGTETREMAVTKAPAFLTKAQTINLVNLNLNVDQKLSLAVAEGAFHSDQDDLGLKNVSLNCNRAQAQAELIDQALVGCVESMNLSTSQFSSSMVEKSLGIKGLKLSVNQGDLNLSAEIKAQISGTAKGKGKISYDPATGVISLKLNEVKFGILNVTGQVFDALKKEESAKLKVQKPWIYYTVK